MIIVVLYLIIINFRVYSIFVCFVAAYLIREMLSMNPMLLCHPVIGDRVYLAENRIRENDVKRQCHFFSTTQDFVYIPICDDFGPMNLHSVVCFSEMLADKISAFEDAAIVYCVESNSRDITNAAFLLGSYLILKLGLSPDDVWSCFSAISHHFSAYRDASYLEQDFKLTLLDCWSGLARANTLKWVDLFDIEEYAHYDNPLEGDLHMIIPDKIIAFPGPRTMPADVDYTDEGGCRRFSPSFYSHAFKDMNVSTVVRLNEEHYDPEEFRKFGVDCLGLEFQDCTAPPQDIVIRFLHSVEHASGAVAVHCKAGLGRTGTLIAIHLMVAHGFTAREAMGWIRIVRPGSVLGEQQHYLCLVEHFLPRPSTPSDLPSSKPPRSPVSSEALRHALAAAGRAMGRAESRKGHNRMRRSARSAALAAQVTSALFSDVRTARRVLRSTSFTMNMPDLNRDD